MMKFNPGNVLMTRSVNDMVVENSEFASHVHLSIMRHMAGDWGNVSDDDRVANELALQSEDRLLSVYEKEELPKILIITEWDRSATTVLFPDEY